MSITNHFPRKISPKQCQDTGMALSLVAFLIGYFFSNEHFYLGGIIIHIVNMIVPRVYRMAAFIWFGLSTILGTVVSKILLSIVFIALVVPVGLFRKLVGIDNLKLKKWKDSSASVFNERNHKYAAGDLETPY